MNVATDERLTRRAVGGDERAFAAIFDRYHQSLYRFCLAILRDPQDAQDALQNTMVKVLGALPGERRQIDLKPWLYRIAHNESIELLRRRRETGQLDPEQAAPGSGLAEEAATRERLRGLLADLDELPERQRSVLVMRELAGLDFDEIGAALSTTPAVARQTLYEARLGLRQMDEGREMECRVAMRALSDGDGRVARRRDIRAHLRGCADCRAFRAGIEGRERDLAALAPLPAVAAAALLQGLLGGNGAGGGLAAALGGGAGKTLGGTAILKGAATVAVVAALGGVAAERGGLIHVGSGSGEAPATRPAQGAAVGPAAPGAAGSRAARLGERGAVAGAGRPGRIGSARRTAKAANGRSGNEVETGGGSTAAQAGAEPATVHPSGRGHEKHLPSASAHGQETAASHHSATHGNSAAPGQSSSPAQPAHPAHPATPSTEKATTPAPSSGGEGAHGNPSPPPQAANPEAPPGQEAGKKP